MAFVIRIMSWNLRCFGRHTKNTDEIEFIARVINEYETDIVCIQELWFGNPSGSVRINETEPLQNTIRELRKVRDRLKVLSKNNWISKHSKANKGKQPHESENHHSIDAYGFLYKQDIADGFSLSANDANIMNEGGSGKHLYYRRPAEIHFSISENKSKGKGKVIVEFDVISVHITTPTNQMMVKKKGTSSYPAAGQEIKTLGSILGKRKKPTILVGDMNFDIEKAKIKENPYEALKPMEMRTDEDLETTYTQQKKFKEGTRFSAAYDRVFDNLSITPSGTPIEYYGKANRIDFIKDAEEKKLYKGTCNADRSYQKLYMPSNSSKRGISDHMPVYADYEIKTGSDDYSDSD